MVVERAADMFEKTTLTLDHNQVNKLLAEKVAGLTECDAWFLCRLGSDGGYGMWKRDCRHDELEKGQIKRGCYPKSTLPKYTTNLEVLWNLVESMRPYFNFDIESISDTHWACTITTHHPTGTGNRGYAKVESTSLNEAVCLAILTVRDVISVNVEFKLG